MNFNKFKSYFVKKNKFESMVKFRYIVYINDLPFFLISKELFVIKRRYIKFEIREYINPKSAEFISDVLSDKITGIDGVMKINRIGPVGDTMEENIYSGVSLKKFNINSLVFTNIGYSYDMTSDKFPVVQLEFKFKKNTKIIN